MAKKKFALIPEEQEKECIDHLWCYQGKIPNTGKILCILCGEEYIENEQWRFEGLLTPRG